MQSLSMSMRTSANLLLLSSEPRRRRRSVVVTCDSQGENGSSSSSSFPSRIRSYVILKLQLQVAVGVQVPELRMKKLLKKAVEEERFQDAARYRDELNKIAPHSLLNSWSDTKTMGIRVEVRPIYIEDRSKPSMELYFFGCRVRITNDSGEPVQ